MHSLLRIVQSSMQPQQKDWNKYVHIHQQSACLTTVKWVNFDQFWRFLEKVLKICYMTQVKQCKM